MGKKHNPAKNPFRVTCKMSIVSFEVITHLNIRPESNGLRFKPKALYTYYQKSDPPTLQSY